MTVMRSRLSDKVLPYISAAKVPAYDRSRIAPGIVHLGIGAFHDLAVPNCHTLTLDDPVLVRRIDGYLGLAPSEPLPGAHG